LIALLCCCNARAQCHHNRRPRWHCGEGTGKAGPQCQAQWHCNQLKSTMVKSKALLSFVRSIDRHSKHHMHFNRKSHIINVPHRTDHWFWMGAQNATERSGWVQRGTERTFQCVTICMQHWQQQVQRGGMKNVLVLSVQSFARIVCVAERSKRSPSFDHHVQVWIVPGKNIPPCCHLHVASEVEAAKERSCVTPHGIQRLDRVDCFRLPWRTTGKDHFSSSLSTLHTLMHTCMLQSIDNGTFPL